MHPPRRILVVESDAAVALVICRHLAAAGYLPDETPLRDIKRRLSGERNYDLVLASLGSLEPSPLDAIAQIKETGVPILLMTGGAEQEVIAKAVAMGVYGPLLKPFTPTDLLTRVRDLLEG